MSYYTESQKTRSEKIIFATCEAVERVKLFTVAGADYARTVENFVVGVKIANTSLQESVLPLSLNEWNYNPITKTLLINVAADPKTLDVSLVYRFFFSNAPMIKPYDLLNGEEIEWVPLINGIGSIGQQLDDQSTGIVLESNSSIDFINTSGYFDDKFDSLIWENKPVKIYSYFPNIPITEKIQLFDGVIESKSFSELKVTFKIKDFVYKLRNKVNLGLYSDSDGIMLPSLIGTSKRRVYGKADYVQCASLDATLNGYALTGTMAVAAPSLTITGTSTLFLDEVSPNDELIFIVNGEEFKLGVESVNSNTDITVSRIPDFSFAGASVNRSEIAWRKKNRIWHLSGHKLYAPSEEILAVNSLSTFTVASVSGYEAGDVITINGQLTTVRRTSGDKIITTSNIIPAPIVGDTIDKRPISNVFLGARKLIYQRDYSEVNTTEAIITLDALAEFNNQEQRALTTTFTFTNASRTIITTETIDLSSTLKPRDWVRSSDISDPDWYEILSVKPQEIILRTNFTGASGDKTSFYKNVEYVNENSLVTANCTGMDSGGLWIKSASDAVRNLVLNDGEFASVNESTFTKANANCPYVLSIVIPEELGRGYPLVRDVATLINESVFGSLYGDSAQNISYAIMNSTKPVTMEEIKDHDVLNFSVQTNQNIINEAKINYRPYVDVYSGDSSFNTVSFQSNFVNRYVGIKSSTEKKLYLYYLKDAAIMAQRICLYNSLSNSSLTLKTKMNLSQVNLNDKVYLSLDRLFGRFSSTDTRKIGIVTGIKRNGFENEITLTDIGNIYNRVMSIAPIGSSEFSSATDDEKIRFCYIVDNDTETPDNTNEDLLGSNIIG